MAKVCRGGYMEIESIRGGIGQQEQSLVGAIREDLLVP